MSTQCAGLTLSIHPKPNRSDVRERLGKLLINLILWD